MCFIWSTNSSVMKHECSHMWSLKRSLLQPEPSRDILLNVNSCKVRDRCIHTPFPSWRTTSYWQLTNYSLNILPCLEAIFSICKLRICHSIRNPLNMVCTPPQMQWTTQTSFPVVWVRRNHHRHKMSYTEITSKPTKWWEWKYCFLIAKYLLQH